MRGRWLALDVTRHIGTLVPLAALEYDRIPKHRADPLAKPAAAVHLYQQLVGMGEAPMQQILQQRFHLRTVLGTAFRKAQDDLLALGRDAHRYDHLHIGQILAIKQEHRKGVLIEAARLKCLQ